MKDKGIVQGIGYTVSIGLLLIAGFLFIHWESIGKNEFIVASSAFSTLGLLLATLIYIHILSKQLQIMSKQRDDYVEAAILSKQPCVYASPEFPYLCFKEPPNTIDAISLKIPVVYKNSGDSPAVNTHIYASVMKIEQDKSEIETQTKEDNIPVLATYHEANHGKTYFGIGAVHDGYILKRLLEPTYIRLQLKIVFKNMTGAEFTFVDKFDMFLREKDEFRKYTNHDDSKEELLRRLHEMDTLMIDVCKLNKFSSSYRASQ